MDYGPDGPVDYVASPLWISQHSVLGRIYLRAALAQTPEPRTVAQPPCMQSFSVSTCEHIRKMCSVQDSVLPQGVGLRKPHIFSSLLASYSFLLTPHTQSLFLCHSVYSVVSKTHMQSPFF